MELLSNLVWIAVALALWGVWLAEQRRGRGAWLRSGIMVQVTALAVLTMILLPVISVSDDLQASHNPAEAERTCVRNDHHLLRPEAVPPAPAPSAVVISCLQLASPRTIALLRPPSFPRSERTVRVRVFAPRPPPAA
ncbi:MAG: hypothetical protein WBW84_11590 [Acidobacteriaceae bacterium]